MVSITLAVPSELKHDMDEFPEINWSHVAREAIIRKIALLRKFRDFTGKSGLTQEDAIRLGRDVNRKVAKAHKS